MQSAILSRGMALICAVTIQCAVTDLAVAKKSQFISIGTGGVAGVYFPTGGAICRLVNKQRKRHRIRCSVESTGGSIYNLNAIREGDLDFGVVQSDWQYHAYKGTSKFQSKGADTALRAVFSIHPEPVTVMAQDGSGIKHIKDIRGRRFNIGNVGSGTRGTWEILERALGWKRSDLKHASELKSGDMSQALCEDKFDAFISLVGHPSASTEEAVASCNAKLVDVSGGAIDGLVRDNSYYRYATIPGGLYKGNPNDIKTYGVGATLVTSAGTAEVVVYELVMAVFKSFKRFRKLHPALKHLKKTEMVKDGLSAPLHAGAEKAFKELGLLQ